MWTDAAFNASVRMAWESGPIRRNLFISIVKSLKERESLKTETSRSPLAVQWVKDLVSLLWHRFNPLLGNFHVQWVWPKKKETSIIYNVCFIGKNRALWEGKDWEFGISRGKLLYIVWTNKALLYSTKNSFQNPMTNCNGKRYEKVYTHTHTHTPRSTLLYSRN